jgi:TPR repeat protein
MYENGSGVTQDYLRARQWFQKARGVGDADAKQRLQNVSH